MADASPHVYRQYLIDYEYVVNDDTLFATMGHLVAFNPGPRDATLQVTIFYEDREPTAFSLPAPAGKSTESNYTKWPVQPNTRFALQVESSEPIICQATVGWTNTKNDYDPAATTKSPHGVRECAKSYMAIRHLGSDWYLADGVVIDRPDQLWIRESEWAVLFNPGETPTLVTMALYGHERTEHAIEVPARRLRCVYMDDIVQRNVHYGVHITGDQPLAAQWLRTVNWYDRPDLMAFWSVPGTIGPLGS